MHAHYSQVFTSASMLSSIVRIQDLSVKLQRYTNATVAITDPKLYGLLPFYREMKKYNIRPVLGLTVSVEFEGFQLPIILYAKNKIGYQHLLKISSASSLKEMATLPLKWLKGYKEGLIAMIPIVEGWTIDAEEPLKQIHTIFGEDCYIGIERISAAPLHMEEQWKAVAEARNILIVATQKVTYLNEEDKEAFEVALSIQQGVRVEDRMPLTERQQQQYLPAMEGYEERFADQKEWLENEKNMLEKCKVELQFETHYMPVFTGDHAETSEELLKQQCFKGLREKGYEQNKLYEERLEYELGVILKMGYADYFLIVADYIAYAHSQHILTGPGRGSSASSLVAYCLGITNVDPIYYDLLFERFLNPERVTLPDIDVDFADSRRQEVIDYVVRRYGAQHATQIITFGTLSAKAVARDVARVLGFTMEEMAQISSILQSRTIEKLADAKPQIEAWIDGELRKEKWFDIAMKLEGLNRNASTHAAGVVLSPIPLPDIAPIEAGGEEMYVTQWPMKEIEAIGLLKMDFLGLRNLTILDQIRKSLYFNERQMIDFDKVPLDDSRTFQLLQAGDTTGVFQLESQGMRAALREIKPTNFSDVVAINALYRPGPMDFIPVYSRRKQGLEVVQMLHPVLEPILRETFGVIVYQEQIMKIAATMAGYSYGEADLLRRAVSKKNKSSLDAGREKFIHGSKVKGFDIQIANDVYDLIVKFANYGFPKSHAVAYSMITFQMAYLKANFPIHFYAALLTNAIGDREKQQQILREASARNLEVLPPSIEKSGTNYRVEDGKIRLSLRSIKGVPNNFMAKLQSLRKEGKGQFETIFQMALNFSATYFKVATIEPLIKAGALDSLGKDRATLLATVERAEKLAKLYSPNEENMLFYDTAIYGVPKHAKVEEMDEADVLRNEKDVLGFYVSTHPATKIRENFPSSTMPISRVSTIKERTYVKCLGAISHLKKIRTKKGEQMAFATLEDDEAIVSITMFPQLFEQHDSWLEEGRYAYVEGFIEYRNHAPQIIVKKMEQINN